MLPRSKAWLIREGTTRSRTIRVRGQNQECSVDFVSRNNHACTDYVVVEGLALIASSISAVFWLIARFEWQCQVDVYSMGRRCWHSGGAREQDKVLLIQ